MGWKSKEEVLAFTGGKICIFGDTGTGKSTFLGTFPRINLVDTEAGQAFYLEDNDNILNVLPTVSAAEVQEALDELNDESIINEFDTIGIDSGTKLNENMQAAAYEVVENRARKQRQKGKQVDLDDLNLSQRDWGHIKRWNQQLATAYILFSNLGKWTVVTAHLKDVEQEVKTANGETKKIKIGERPDLAKKAEFDFDIILKSFVRVNEKTGEREFCAEVIKDRTKVTNVGDILVNPSFEIWRERWERTRKFGAKNVNLSSSVDADKSRFEFEQEQENEIVDKFKNLINTLSQTDKKELIAQVKKAKIENPLKPKDANEFSVLNNLVTEFEEKLK